jgi:hypothetical protein
MKIALPVLLSIAVCAAIPSYAATTTKKTMTPMTHEQCISMRMGKMKTASAKQNADKWCTKHHNMMMAK